MRKAGLYRSHTNKWLASILTLLLPLSSTESLFDAAQTDVWLQTRDLDQKNSGIDSRLSASQKDFFLFSECFSPTSIGTQSLSILIWSRSVLALCDYRAPTSVPNILCTYWTPSTSCVFMFDERGQVKISRQRWMSGWRVREEEEEGGGGERKAGGSKKKNTSSSSVKNKTKNTQVQKISPHSKDAKKETKTSLWILQVEIQDTTTALALRLKSHTQCTFCLCLKLKHPWFKVHSVVRGGEGRGGGDDGKRRGGSSWGQHVGWCSM